jgi:hypothetical protein
MPRRSSSSLITQERIVHTKRPNPKPARDRSEPTPQWAEFGAYLRLCLLDAGLTYAAFAKQLPGQRNESMDPSMLSKVGTGLVAPPEYAASGFRGADGGKALEKATPWAKVLGLSGKEAEEFEFRIWLARTPPMVWVRFKEMEQKLAKQT